MRQRGDELAGQVRALRAELERQQQDREGERQQSLQLLATLQQDVKAQQHCGPSGSTPTGGR